MAIPDYRLRLFTSVDLAGSTAFKAGSGKTRAKPDSPHPLWIVVIRKFYDTFPKTLQQKYESCLLAKTLDENQYPSLKPWKTIGDEILFCCRLTNFVHLSVCMLAFVEALKAYGDILEADELSLDVKGNAWVAAFPAINMTATRVALQAKDYLEESFEAAADSDPNAHDFLGPEIDAGFRLAKYASPEKCALSVQLAWLLTKHGNKFWHMESFVYDGRDVLKGVLNDKLYPIISLAADRNLERAELRAKEDEITGLPRLRVSKLHEFLDGFLKLERVEFPVLPDGNEGPLLLEFPETYREFKNYAEAQIKGNEAQDTIIRDSLTGQEGPATDDELPLVIEEAAKLYRKHYEDTVLTPPLPPTAPAPELPAAHLDSAAAPPPHR